MEQLLSSFMDEATYLDLYGARDPTTTFLRSLHCFPQVERIFKEDLFGKKEGFLEIAVVGCSYGHEVYSYALLCEMNGFKNYQVDGYEVHAGRLSRAREGELWWGMAEVSSDHRIQQALEKKLLLEDNRGIVVIHEDLKRKTRFFPHDISFAPLPREYDVLVCTNVLGQVQRGGRENAIRNLLTSLRRGGLIIQNYGTLGEQQLVEERVNMEIQTGLRLPM